ncbi:MAG: four-carbon acid sugar kinase family protein, partial [Armatimonadota bacterium]
MRWAIVADDLTGAADAAVPFADRGIETTVWLGEPKEFPDGTCCSVDSDARRRDAEKAAKVIRKYVCSLRDADWLVLKIDSTLRGFVGAMVEGAWQASGRKWALILPAVPKQGRKVVNGKLLAHGKPVNELDLAKEQPVPVTTPSVSERLQDTGLEKLRLEHLTLKVVRHRDSLAQAIERAAINKIGLICDAETDKDLVRIVSFAAKAPTQPLFIGASGLTQALVKVTGKNFVKRKPSSQLRPNRILIVVGSQQTLAQEQIKFLASKGVPVGEFGDELLVNWEVVALQLRIGERSSIGVKFRQWLKSNSFDAFVIVGGLTARTIFDALRVRRWSLLGSLLPGMPLGLVQLHDRNLLVATKAGGFGTKQTLWRAILALQRREQRIQTK